MIVFLSSSKRVLMCCVVCFAAEPTGHFLHAAASRPEEASEP